VAHALHIENNAVTVECRRMGGGFGGKETQAGHLAVWAALAANKLKRPVKLRLDRDDDFMVTGKRHPFAYDYTVGFDDTGLVTALQAHHAGQLRLQRRPVGPGGRPRDLPCGQRLLPERCRDHLVPLQDQHAKPHGVSRLRRAAGRDRDRSHHGRHRAALGLDPLDVRMRNLYGVDERNVTHYQMKVEDNILEPLLTQLAKHRATARGAMRSHSGTPPAR
jgi:xanthine dehydrogenase large subunit